MNEPKVYFALETQQERESNSYVVWYRHKINGNISRHLFRESSTYLDPLNSCSQYYFQYREVVSKMNLKCQEQRKELQKIVEIIKSTTEIIDDIVYNILQFYLLLV
jgi:hypothetical protein